jgi:hypothetical protein
MRINNFTRPDRCSEDDVCIFPELEGLEVGWRGMAMEAASMPEDEYLGMINWIVRARKFSPALRPKFDQVLQFVYKIRGVPKNHTMPIPLNNILYPSSIYLRVPISHWDTDARDLQACLTKEGVPVKEILERHYNMGKDEDLDTFGARFVSPRIVAYGTPLEENYLRQAMLLTGNNLEIQVRNGYFENNGSEERMIGAYGITVFTKALGPVDERKEKIAKVEKVISDFYQEKSSTSDK